MVQVPKWAHPLHLVPLVPVSLPIRNAGSIPLSLSLSFETSIPIPSNYNNIKNNNNNNNISPKRISETSPYFEASAEVLTIPVGGVEKIDVSFLPNGILFFSFLLLLLIILYLFLLHSILYFISFHFYNWFLNRDKHNTSSLVVVEGSRYTAQYTSCRPAKTCPFSPVYASCGQFWRCPYWERCNSQLHAS